MVSGGWLFGRGRGGTKYLVGGIAYADVEVGEFGFYHVAEHDF